MTPPPGGADPDRTSAQSLPCFHTAYLFVWPASPREFFFFLAFTIFTFQHTRRRDGELRIDCHSPNISTYTTYACS